MRRWLTATALGGALALTLTGCGGNPSGIDGDLIDDWAAIGKPVVFTPDAGTCHESAEEGSLDSYEPIDCAEQHTTETLYVGTFATAEADRPASGSSGLRTANAACDKQVNQVLGGDWHTARLTSLIVLPTNAAWAGGARWYRCDVAEIGGLNGSVPVPRTGSLKGALAKASKLTYGCFEPKLAGGDVTAMQPVACTAKHHSEFAGIFTAPDTSFDVFEKNEDQIKAGCLKVIAGFAKVPNDGNLKFRTGWIYYFPREQEWADGNRAVQCFMWLNDGAVTKSLKGAGTKGLPVS